MDPRNFSTKTKRDAWKRCAGHCEKCTTKLTTGNIRYDHVIPWEISHDSSLENCQVLCLKSCDHKKTYEQDIPTIAKVRRIFDRAHGIEKQANKSLPGGRDSDVTITMRHGPKPRVKQRGAKDRAVIEKRRIGAVE